MKNWCAKVFFSVVILLNGYGNVYAHHNPFNYSQFSHNIFSNIDINSKHNLNNGHSFESFKRKMCLCDNEENEDNFSAAQKQLVKNNYFLIFHSSNHFVASSTAFTQKVNDCKIFSLLYNKVYLLFQVFRI